MAQRAEEAALRRRLSRSRDAEIGEPASGNDIDHPFGDLSNQDIRDLTVEELKRRAVELEDAGHLELAGEVNALLERIEQLGVDQVRILDDAEYERTLWDWYQETPTPGDVATVNLDTGEIILRRSQIVRPGDTIDDVINRAMLTVYHEEVHYRDWDHDTVFEREKWAYERTIDLADALGLKYSALGKEDLGHFIRMSREMDGEKEWRDLIKRQYRIAGDPHRPSKHAAIRSGRFQETVYEWFTVDILPILAKNERILNRTIRDDYPSWLNNDPVLIWQYARYISGENIAYDSINFDDLSQDRDGLRRYLESLPGPKYLDEVPSSRRYLR